jgi:hypothetical protein
MPASNIKPHLVIRTRRFRLTLASFVALLAIELGAMPAVAWTLLFNNFDSMSHNPDYPDVHGEPASCTGVDPFYCVEWPLQNGHSTTTYVYLTDSLDDNLSGETLNFKTQARNAFGRWNAVPAYAPYLVEADSISDASGLLPI